jgi:hypothetical protein
MTGTFRRVHRSHQQRINCLSVRSLDSWTLWIALRNIARSGSMGHLVTFLPTRVLSRSPSHAKVPWDFGRFHPRYSSSAAAEFLTQRAPQKIFPGQTTKHSPATADTGRRVSGANQQSPHGSPNAVSGFSPQPQLRLPFLILILFLILTPSRPSEARGD